MFVDDATVAMLVTPVVAVVVAMVQRMIVHSIDDILLDSKKTVVPSMAYC